MLLPLLSLLTVPVNLIPDRPSTAPDYFCTWNIQGYACSYTGVGPTRAEINEANLFGEGKAHAWLDFYPQARSDLLFVMDDSWDVPPDGDERQLGRLELDESKFPGFAATPGERLAKLAKAVRNRGWKGLGGWVCAQECQGLPKLPERAYWQDRLSGLRAMSYLKVDWGRHANDPAWRRLLAELKPSCCPQTSIEAALTPEAIRFADTYRTYDVEAILSAPTTLLRLSTLLNSPEAKKSPTILNCEDEVYIGAGLGCSYGVMRHPLVGPLPNGAPDFVFPSSCRNLKRRLDEVTRAARWHRLASPIPVGQVPFAESTSRLTDHWTYAANESWISHPVGADLTATAPAVMARGLPLPRVTCSQEPPFVVAAKYMNGCVSVAAIGRARGRTYTTPLADVKVDGVTVGKAVGVFGRYKSLSLHFRGKRPAHIWAQDLAGTSAVEITREVTLDGNTVTVPGNLIGRLGCSAGHAGDLSDPGLVLLARQ